MMASRSIQYVCRDCRHALKTSISKQTTPAARSKTRSFTSTSSQLRALATFTPTDRPALDELFAQWRSDVFLPSVISLHHQAILYKVSRSSILTLDPGVSVSVQTQLPPSEQEEEDKSEEVIRLWPKDAFNGPNTKKSLKVILNELKESGSAKTWENIIPFLHGCQQARRRIPWSFRQSLVRVANDRNDGRWNAIVQAAVYSKMTGVTLAEMPLTTELVVGLHDRAAQANYSLDVASRKLLTQIIVLLEDEAHCGSSHWQSKGPLYQDMRSSLVVLGTQLAFSASKVLQDEKNKETQLAKVSRDAKKLLAVLKESDGSFSEEVNDELCPRVRMDFRETIINIREYEVRVILLAALSLVTQVDMSQSLGKTANIELNLALKQARQQIQSKLDSTQKNFKAFKTPPQRCYEMRKNVEQALSKL